MSNKASGAPANTFISLCTSVCASTLTCGRMTLSIFFRAVSGEGGEQSGVGPVVQLPWLLGSPSLTDTWDR